LNLANPALLAAVLITGIVLVLGATPSSAASENRLYVGDEDGRLVVYGAGGKLDILARIEMPAPLYGAPAAAGDTMFLATEQWLFAI
jgi:hypothetical protein